METLNGYIVIEKVDNNVTTSSGLSIGIQKDVRYIKAKVFMSPKEHPIKKGDIVLYDKNQGHNVVLGEGKEYKVIKDINVVMIM